MTTYPRLTRAELSKMLEKAEKGHRDAMMEADAARAAAEMLRLKLARRGCCTVDGGEDGGEGG